MDIVNLAYKYETNVQKALFKTCFKGFTSYEGSVRAVFFLGDNKYLIINWWVLHRYLKWFWLGSNLVLIPNFLYQPKFTPIFDPNIFFGHYRNMRAFFFRILKRYRSQFNTVRILRSNLTISTPYQLFFSPSYLTYITAFTKIMWLAEKLNEVDKNVIAELADQKKTFVMLQS